MQPAKWLVMVAVMVLTLGHSVNATENGASGKEVQKEGAENGATKTRVVMLGTGTPQARPEASGPAVAIVAGGAAYLVDAGPYLLVLYRYARPLDFS